MVLASLRTLNYPRRCSSDPSPRSHRSLSFALCLAVRPLPSSHALAPAFTPCHSVPGPLPGPHPLALRPLPFAPRSLSLALCPRPYRLSPDHAPPRPGTHPSRPGMAQPHPSHVQTRPKHVPATSRHAPPISSHAPTTSRHAPATSRHALATHPDDYFFRKALIRLTSSVCSASSGNTSSTSCSQAVP